MMDFSTFNQSKPNLNPLKQNRHNEFQKLNNYILDSNIYNKEQSSIILITLSI